MSSEDFPADVAILEKFLGIFVSEQWIQGFRIDFFSTLRDLRSEWGPSDLAAVSRTHKQVGGSRILGVEVIKSPKLQLGIDLETTDSLDRPLFQNHEFLAKRFGISGRLETTDLMSQWICREASFKALYPDNTGIYLSDFEVAAVDDPSAVISPKLDRLFANDCGKLTKNNLKVFQVRGPAEQSLKCWVIQLPRLFFSIAVIDGV